MSIPGSGSPLLLATTAAAAAADTAYVIPKSLRFDSGDSAHLSKTPSSAGNRRTWTWSGWVKRSKLGEEKEIFDANNGSHFTSISFTADDKLRVYFRISSTNYSVTTTQVFRDPGAWMHIVVAVSTTESTASDRCRLYVNGSEISSFASTGYPPQNSDTSVNATNAHFVGGRSGQSRYFNGYLADVQLVDGQALAPTAFGETRSSDGVWVPKEYTGTYDGYDQSQTWSTSGTVSGFPTSGTYDFAHLFNGEYVTTQAPGTDNLMTSPSGGSGTWTYTISDVTEFKIRLYVPGSSHATANSVKINGSDIVQAQVLDAGLSNDAWHTVTVPNISTFTSLFVEDNYWYVSNIYINGRELVDPSVSKGKNGFHLNFSDSSTNEALGFDSAPTTPDPDPKKGFDVVTYSGTGAVQNIGGLHFEPSLVWFKPRETGNHKLIDSVRGKNKRLESDTTDAEETNNDSILSFNPDGFTLGTAGTVNNSTNTFVAWTWRAGGPAVANTSGTITTQVSANTDYGFSIIKYTGVNNASAQTIGHGLGKVPKFVLIKNLTDAEDWAVYHASLGNTKYLQLNSTAAAATSSAYWNDTDPTSALITLNNSNDVQRINRDYIVYAWSEVAGYSKFSSYTGNGSATGPTVTTGFRPRFLLIKASANYSTGSWIIVDSERSTSNPTDHALFPNSSNDENNLPSFGDRDIAIDFLDNGFQIKNSLDADNKSGATYIFAAFADRPGNNWDVNNIVTNEGLTTSKTQFDVVTYTGNGGTQKIGGPVYSSGWSGSVNATNGAAASFDGDDSTFTRSDTSASCTWTAPSSIAFTTLKIRGARDSGNGTIEVNGVDVSSQFTANSATLNTQTITGVTSPLTSIKLTGNASSQPRIAFVEIDGTKLLDGNGPGLKFEPDLVWIKDRSNSYSNRLADSVRGSTRVLFSDASSEEQLNQYGTIDSFNSDGFTLRQGSNNNGDGSNTNNANMVAWCWNAGDTKIPQVYGTAATVSSAAALSTTLVGPAAINGDSESINYQNLDIDLQEDVTTVDIKVKHAASSITYLVSADGTTWTSKSTGNSMTALSTITISHTSAFRYVRFHYPSGNFGQAFQVINNTDGSLASTVKANSQYGFSIVSYLGTGSAATVGHGLTNPPSLIIIKQRDGTDSWAVYSRPTGASGYLSIEDSSATKTNVAPFNGTDPTSSVFSIAAASGSDAVNRVNLSGKEYIAYCFADVPGYQRIGSYTGNGSSTGPVIPTGFKPRFLLVKRTDSTGSWVMLDSERNPANPRTKSFYADVSDAEYTPGQNWADFDESSFQITATYGEVNASSGTYIYLAIGDDEVGSDEDCLVDVPNAVTADADATDTTGGYQRGNYATFNPLDDAAGGGNASLSNGNLQIDGSSSEQFRPATIAVSSGKWYFEIVQSAGTDFGPGVWAYPLASPSSQFYQNENYRYNSNGGVYDESAKITDYSSFAVGDVIGTALDMDNGKVYFSKNGVWQNNGDPSGTNPAASGLTGQWIFGASTNGNSTVLNANFGQQRFKYPIPSGYAALNTTALPAATIEDGSDYFNTALWTGDGGSSVSVTTGFEPDLIWIKQRNKTYYHQLYDAVRGYGSGKALASNETVVEGYGSPAQYGYVSATSSTGFTGTAGSATPLYVNENNTTYVAWAWDAGSSTVSNTDGSITSSVRANATAGFSIVTYSGNSTSGATIGHGLNAAPEFVVVKARNIGTQGWCVYHASLGATKYIQIDTTNAASTYSGTWNNTSPTNSVFTVGNDNIVNTGYNYVAYCFAPVAGYSAFGSWEGNSSTDGPFVYTGFRPRWIMYKWADGGGEWAIRDTARSTYNVSDQVLTADSTGTEQENAVWNVDILSNGFKIRTSSAGSNSSSTFIYAAFAETPFQANGGLAR